MNMKTSIATLALSMLCLSSLAADKKTTGPGITIEPQGLRIVKPVAGGDAQRRDQQLRAFNWMPGTTVSLLVKAPQGGLIAVMAQESEVASCSDDKGTDLSLGEFQDKAKLGDFSFISTDGKACSIELGAPGFPVAGATKILAKGKLVLMTGTIKKDFAAEKVVLKPNTAVNAGAIPFTIKSAGKPQWGDMPLQVTLEAHQDLSTVADIQFFNAAGKKIESQSSGSMSMRLGDTLTVSRDFLLKEKVDSAKIVITYWMDAKKVVVPLDLKVGVGF